MNAAERAPARSTGRGVLPPEIERFVAETASTAAD
jgi:hypothetical protein